MSFKEIKQEILELKNDLQKYTIGTAAYFVISSRIELLKDDLKNHEKNTNKARILPTK